MKIYKVKSVVLDKALSGRDFPFLRIYLGDFKRTEDNCFLTQINPSPYSNELELKDALSDYLFNEYHECPKLLELAEQILGKEYIDIKVVKVVEI